MSLTYQTYVDQLSNLMVIPSTDANFQTFLPGAIDYAEQRIYRELDLLETQVASSGTATASVRNFDLPTTDGTFIVVDQVNVMSSAGTGSSNGTRNPTTPVTRDFIDAVYPSAQTVTGIPQFFSRQNSSSILFGPAPDAAYTVQIVGTIRPTPLSSVNSSTFLTQQLPDLFMAASMVFASGYMREFTAQSDNPQMGASWELQYRALYQSADQEEVRKKFMGPAWTSESPSAIATPPRV